MGICVLVYECINYLPSNFLLIRYVEEHIYYLNVYFLAIITLNKLLFKVPYDREAGLFAKHSYLFRH